MINLRYILSLILNTFLLFGCESKYVEKSPEQVQITGPSVQSRASEKISTDGELIRFENALEQTSKLINQISLYLREDEQAGTFSVVQLAYNSVKDLKEGMPQYYSDQLFARYSVMKLNGVLASGCEQLDIALSAYPLMQIVKDSKIKKADRFGFFFKSCATDEQYKPLFFIDSNLHNVAVKFIQKNLKLINQNLDNKINNIVPRCDFSFDENGAVSAIECADILFALSENTYSYLKSFKFTANLKISVVAKVFNYKNNIDPGRALLITINESGQVNTTATASNQ